VVDRTTGYAEERVIDMGVAFQRVVDGVPVYGPGGKMVIYLNHAGELTGFDCIWRQVQNLHSPVERLQPLENAFNDLVKRWGRVGNGSIAVKEVRIEYFELGWEHTQRYLQPAFIMPLTIVSNRGRVMMRSEHVFPAAANCVGILMPRLPRQFNRKSAQQTPARTPK
jgi:hypothetical protein